MENLRAERPCATCKEKDRDADKPPCQGCLTRSNKPNWQPKEAAKVEFKIGNSVRLTKDIVAAKKGDTGTIRHIDGRNPPIGVEFDHNIGGHDLPCSPKECRCKDGYGYYVKRDEIELIKEDKPMINTKARDSVAQALRECKDKYMGAFDVAIEAISGAKKPEEVMAAKKELLMTIAHKMPVTSGTCYFCQDRNGPNGKCDKCPYAECHKRCSDNGDYAKIVDAKETLQDALSSYYSGETYTDPEREKRHAEFLRLKAEFESQEVTA
jgi:hypothetical protein